MILRNVFLSEKTDKWIIYSFVSTNEQYISYFLSQQFCEAENTWLQSCWGLDSAWKTQGVFRESSEKFAAYASGLFALETTLNWLQERQYPHWNSDPSFIFAGLWLRILSSQNKIWERVLVKPVQLSAFILYHLQVKNLI